MPAPQSVYAFERHLNDALVRVLSQPGVQVLAFADGDYDDTDPESVIKHTPRIETDFSSGGNGNEVMTLDHAKRKFRSEYSGTVSVRVTCRYGEGSLLRNLVARVRSALSYLVPTLPGVLPAWLNVIYISEASGSGSVSNREDDELQLALSFNITFRIRSDAFISTFGLLLYNDIQLSYNGTPLTYNYGGN